MRTYPYPQMDHDSAILRVDMTGVCGTDKHIFKGEASSIRGKSIFPYIGGEEVNDHPVHAHHRYVINCGEHGEEELGGEAQAHARIVSGAAAAGSRRALNSTFPP